MEKYFLIKCNCEWPNTEPFWSNVKKVETDEVELTQVAALIDSIPDKATVFDKEFAEKIWKFVEE